MEPDPQPESLAIVSSLLARDFDWEDETEAPTYHYLKSYLEDVIDELLHSDHQRLLSILYRIDVDECLVKKTFSEHSLQEIPSILAVLILQRQLQKAETRLKYRQ